MIAKADKKPGQVKRHGPTNNKQIVGTELNHILTLVTQFFLAAGAPPGEIIACVADALATFKKRTPKYKYFSIGPQVAIDRLVLEWRTNPAYVNAAGRPKTIPLKGHQSIAALLDSVGITQSPMDVAVALANAGIARRQVNGQIALQRRYSLYSGKNKKLPYEPSASFLLSAAIAATSGIQERANQRELFWFNSYSDRIPPNRRKQFLVYARAKGQQLLHEMDDWLSSYETAPTKGQWQRSAPTTGIGFFPFVALPPVGNQQRKVDQRQPRTKRS
jgi:hypothetical protein